MFGNRVIHNYKLVGGKHLSRAINRVAGWDTRQQLPPIMIDAQSAHVGVVLVGRLGFVGSLPWRAEGALPL